MLVNAVRRVAAGPYQMGTSLLIIPFVSEEGLLVHSQVVTSGG
jgi:hypothetical protein